MKLFSNDLTSKWKEKSSSDVGKSQVSYDDAKVQIVIYNDDSGNLKKKKTEGWVNTTVKFKF